MSQEQWRGKSQGMAGFGPVRAQGWVWGLVLAQPGAGFSAAPSPSAHLAP